MLVGIVAFVVGRRLPLHTVLRLLQGQNPPVAKPRKLMISLKNQQ
jgi:hypothetical protein